ncbi:unnamed protein product [Sphagnum balticum]
MRFKSSIIFVISLLLLTLNLNSQIRCDDGHDDFDVGDEPGSPQQETFQDVPDAAQTVQKAQYVRPTIVGSDHFFVETFESELKSSKWVKSRAKKEDVDEVIAKYDGEWSIEASTDSVLEGDKGLVLKSKAKHHAISSRLNKPFDFKKDKPLVVQYEVKFQNPMECGGAYIKLISNEHKVNLEDFFDKTGFTIMFGPDKCGPDNKYHFILRYKNPKTGVYEEKHAKKATIPDGLFTDTKTHLFTLIVRPDNTFSMLIDQNEVNSGSLLKDLTPSINPPKEIVDPNDRKPENWDDRERIPDPDAVKPEDWDENEPKQIPDPNAVKPADWLEDEPSHIADETATKPSDWDTETDGEWEAPKIDNPKCKSASGCGKWLQPMIDNPKYRGIWRPPMIENTNYQGKWEPRRIENPDFFEDLNPFSALTSFSAVGLELWSMTDQIYFDNFIITDEESTARQLSDETWKLKHELETSNSKSSADNILTNLINATNDKPWLWAIYVLVVLIPLVLVVVFCCGSKSGDAKSAAADRKKTDEPTPDDEQELLGEVEAEVEAEAEAKEEASKLTKSDLESKTNGTSNGVDHESDDGEEESKPSKSKKSASPKKKTRKD